MGNNFSNDYLKRLNDTVLNGNWMNELYGTQRTEQQDALKKIFTVVSENNVTSAEKKALEAKAETIQEKVERLEAKMAVLEEELAKNEKEISRHADEIASLVTQADTASEKAEYEQQQHVKNVVEDVLYALKNGEIQKVDDVGPEIQRRLESGITFRYNNDIDAILKKLNNKQAEVTGLVASAEKWINQNKILQAQYGATKSTYDLLNATIANIGATNTTYTNSDFDKNVPTFSPEKVGVVSKYSENPNINVEAGPNSAYIEGSKAPDLESLGTIKEKYKDLLGTKTTGEAYSSSNQAVVNLGKALDMGLFKDLAATGLSANQVADFIAQNFAGAKITKNGNNLAIPYGHDAGGREIYAKLTKEINNYNSSFKGTLNTWDKEGGNTIGTNKQIASLNENGADILKDLKDSGFTFKEAMFALFDPDYGIFKDSGISYNLDKQGATPNYFIEFAGDSETAKLYEDLSADIYDYWGVKPSRGLTSETYQDDTTPDIGGTTDPVVPEPGTPSKPTVSRTDPIWFNIDEDKNNKFSFVIDRDADGTFSDSTEFVGGTNNASWLDDLKSLDTDGDNKLTGDELKNLKVLGTNFQDGAQVATDNNEYTPDKKASTKGFERETTTNVEYSLSNANAMGISEIDLNGLESQVNQSQGIVDINNSEKFSDSFSFKMNGKEVTAHRQDETTAYMDTVYSDAYGKAFDLGMKEADVDEIMKKDYGEYDKFYASYADVFSDINVLRNIDDIEDQVDNQRQDTLERIADFESVEKRKGERKAAATKDSLANWSTMRDNIQQVAIKRGVTIDMEQAKGLYALNGTLSAEDIVNNCLALVQEEKDILSEQGIQKEVWKTIIKAAEADVTIPLPTIKEKLLSGEAHTAEDVVRLFKEENPDKIDINLVTKELGFDSEREEEIYETFNSVFNGAGLSDKVVDALYDLCVNQQNNHQYMLNKSAEQLAKDILKNYQ